MRRTCAPQPPRALQPVSSFPSRALQHLFAAVERSKRHGIGIRARINASLSPSASYRSSFAFVRCYGFHRVVVVVDRSYFPQSLPLRPSERSTCPFEPIAVTPSSSFVATATLKTHTMICTRPCFFLSSQSSFMTLAIRHGRHFEGQRLSIKVSSYSRSCISTSYSFRYRSGQKTLRRRSGGMTAVPLLPLTAAATATVLGALAVAATVTGGIGTETGTGTVMIATRIGTPTGRGTESTAGAPSVGGEAQLRRSG